MKGKLYAMQITRRHLDLVTLINGGLTPDDSMMKTSKHKHWLIFELEENGKDSINHQIVSERTLFQTYELIGSCPMLLRVTKL
jgi:hypothetical protein